MRESAGKQNGNACEDAATLDRVEGMATTGKARRKPRRKRRVGVVGDQHELEFGDERLSQLREMRLQITDAPPSAEAAAISQRITGMLSDMASYLDPEFQSRVNLELQLWQRVLSEKFAEVNN